MNLPAEPFLSWTDAVRVVRALVCAVGLSGVGGCSFDGSALDARGPCVRDSDCPSGVCVAGNCWYGATIADAQDVTHDGTPADATDAAVPDTDGPVCTPNASICVGNVAQTCDADGQRATSVNCSAPEACDAARGCACVEGRCEPRVCEPGTRICQDAERVLACDATGTRQTVSQTCDDETTCIGGACVQQLCTPGDVYCAGTSIVTCNDLGRPVATVECAEQGRTCVEADGGPLCAALVCAPSATRCGPSGVPEVCDDTGQGWIALSPCADGTTCDAGVCVGSVCTPGARTCGPDGEVLVCTPDGQGQTPTLCAAGTSCTGGVCVGSVCVAGEVFCTDRTVSLCNAEGTAFSSVETCAGACVDGACAAPFCGDELVQTDLRETCDDGNDAACDGCEDCVDLRVLGTTARSVVTPSAPPAIVAVDVVAEAWVLPEEGDGPWFGVGALDSTAQLHVGAAGGRIYAEMALGTGAPNRVRVVAPTPAVAGVWYHVAASRFGLRNLVLWVNGQPVASGRTTGAETALRPTRGVWIGSDGTLPLTTPLRMSGLRVTLATRYTSPFLPPRFLPEPDGAVVAQYPLNEREGDVARDASDTNGTIRVTDRRHESDTCFGASSTAYVCGDGVRAPWEACDDGNNVSGDGCSEDCQIERGCDDGWIPGLRGECYRILSPANWMTSRDRCVEEGGTLATLNDAIEHLHVHAHVTRSTAVTWIGLSDREREGVFTWVDGSSSTYRFWAPNRPVSTPNNSDDCVAISLRPDGSWLDLDCNNNRPGLCKR
jgi:cysteine-rich repeat protein